MRWPPAPRGAAGLTTVLSASGLAASGLLASTLLASALALAGCAAKAPVPPLPAATPAAATVMDIVGLDAAALERRLGRPGLVWREEPAQVWQYRSRACVLNVYLYRDNGRLTVSDAEAHSKAGRADPLPSCLAALTAARQKPVRG